MFVLAMGIGLGKPIVSPTRAEAISFCSLIPDPVSRKLCHVAGSVTNAVGLPSPQKIVGSAANLILRPVIVEFTNLATAGMTASMKKMTMFISNTTTANFTVPWYIHMYEFIFGGMIPFGIAMFLIRAKVASQEADAREAFSATAGLLAFFYFALILPSLVNGITAFLDGFAAPHIMSTSFHDIGSLLKNPKLDFTKGLSASNNPITPILEPAFFALFGFIGGLITEVMFTVRVLVLYVLIAAEVVAMAVACSGKFGSDLLIRCSMALIGWMFLKVVMAFTLYIGIGVLGGATFDSILLGMMILLGVPTIGWIFVKVVASHRISLLGSAINFQTAASRLPMPSRMKSVFA
jgi:hypothetical protein